MDIVGFGFTNHKLSRFGDGIIHEIGFTGSLVLRIMGDIYQCVCLTTLLAPG